MKFPIECHHSSLVQYHKYVSCSECGSTILPSELSRQGLRVIQDPSCRVPTTISFQQLFRNLMRDQDSNLVKYDPNAPYLSQRSELVQWILEMQQSLVMQEEIAFLAVSYLDTALLNSEAEEEEFDLVALSSLVLASKLRELFKETPTMVDFQYAATKVGIIDIEAIKSCEVKLLNILNFKLQKHTSLCFLELLLSQGILLSSDSLSSGKVVDTTLAVELTAKSRELLRKSLLAHECLEYHPAVIACSCAVAARHALGIFQPWTPYFEYLTGISYIQVQMCLGTVYLDIDLWDDFDDSPFAKLIEGEEEAKSQISGILAEKKLQSLGAEGELDSLGKLSISSEEIDTNFNIGKENY